MKSLSIIIPNYNGEELLTNYLPSIINACENYNGTWEIIIIDDRSKDNSVTILKNFNQKNSNIKYAVNNVNLGFSGTCNEGMKLAQGEILFFLNNDVTLEKNFFNFFNEYFLNNSTFAVTVKGFKMDDNSILDGSKILTWKRGMPRVTANRFETYFDEKGIYPYVSDTVQGAYFFVDSSKMQQLGGFDELFAPYIFEETDLSYRALKRGWKIYYEPRCVAHHALSATISKKKKKAVKLISLKNKLVFVWKNISSSQLLLSHFLFLTLRLLTFNLLYWKAVNLALKNLSEIRKKKEVERNNAIISDNTIFNSKFI